jgi:hypothetical protein
MIYLPKFVARVNFKPLALEDALHQMDPEKILKSVRREIIKAVRAKLQLAAFSKRAREVLAKGFRTKMGPSSLTIYAKHPSFMPLVMGMKSQQMTWLLGAKAPIPIVLDSGKVIFRTASARSMKNGGWIHPGHQPTTIVEQARKEARKIVQARIRKEIHRQLRMSLKA